MSEGHVRTIGFDIGGTNLRGAVVENGEIIDAFAIPTPQTPQELYNGIHNVVDVLRRRNSDIAAVGVAIAGFVDQHCEQVRFAPHLSFRDEPVRQHLQDVLGLPVTIEHDANSAAWGEYRFGAAQGKNIWALINLGTGIGGALMINGELYRGAYGTAPEWGHVVVVPDGRECPCGKRGCWERYCSGTALGGKAVMKAAKAGEESGLAAVAELATWLGKGLSMVADVFDPELIVVGGGLAADADMFLPQASTIMADNMVGAGHRPVPRVSVATLGPDAGMIGVADLAARDVSQRPQLAAQQPAMNSADVVAHEQERPSQR